MLTDPNKVQEIETKLGSFRISRKVFKSYRQHTDLDPEAQRIYFCLLHYGLLQDT